MQSRQHQQKNKTISWFSELLFWIVVIFLIRTFGFGLYQVPTGSMETTILVGERFFADKFSYLFVKPKQGDIISFNEPTFNYSSNKIKRLFQEYVWGPVNITKRVVATPGQTVKGIIEDGKPVIYIDGKKLDEPYLNKYPLISVYTVDKQELYNKIEQKVLNAVMHRQIPMNMLEGLIQEEMSRYVRSKSFDPSVPLDKQPFYRIKQDRIFTDEQGNPILKYPQTPLPQCEDVPEQMVGKNHWNGTDDFYVELGANQYWVMGDNRLGSADARFWGPLDGRFIHGKIVFRIWSLDSDSDWWIIDLIKHPIDFWTRVRWSRCLQFVH